MKKWLAFVAVTVALVVPRVLIAEETSSLSKTVAAISEKLAAREYQKAFSYVEFLIKLYKGDSMPQEAIDISGQAVELYSQDLLARKKWQDISDLAARLSGAPLAVQARAKDPIFRATAELTAQEEARNAKKRAALAAAKAADEKKKALSGTSSSAATEAAAKTAAADSQETAFNDLRSEIEGFRADAERHDAALRANIVLLFSAVIVLLACFVALCFVFFSYRNSLRKRGSKAGVDFDVWSAIQSPGPSEDFEKTCAAFSEEEIRSLLRVGASAGRIIDAHTQRRNNSRDVGRLVYVISRRVGYSHKAASIFSAAGMIRDIGLLSVDAAVFGSPAVAEEGIAQIRSHVKAAETTLLLIDERIRTTLARGIELHHENLDGSGYAEKVKGRDIPYLSRVLRLIESYVSLVSKSKYHAMKNSEEAIGDLRGQSNWYDASLIDVLADEV